MRECGSDVLRLEEIGRRFSPSGSLFSADEHGSKTNQTLNMKSIYLTLAAFLIALIGLSPAPARAQQLTIPITYGSEAYYEPESLGESPSYGNIYNYLYLGANYNNYFIFNLSQIPAGDIVTSATLSITETLPMEGAFTQIDLLSTDLPPAEALSSGSNTYNALVDGSSVMQSATFAQDIDPTFYDVTVTGNNAFLNVLNSNIGGQVLIGTDGMYTTRSDGGTPTLIVNVAPAPVPEPSEATLVAMTLVAGGLIAWRKKRRKNSAAAVDG
jgi:hypothetical protein